MRALLILACVGLTGCGAISSVTGSLGSLGFGGAARTAQPVSRAQLRPLVPANRPSIAERRRASARISRAELTPTSQGALLRVEANPAGPGAFNAELATVQQSGGTLLLELRLQQAAAATVEPRKITVARAFSHRDLAGVSRIQIRDSAGLTTLRR